MLGFLGGLIIVLHGFVHIWYVVLSQKLVAFQPAMVWTGKSWLLTNRLGEAATRWFASLLYVLATLGMVVGGIGVMTGDEWGRWVLISAAVLSSATIFVFWDGSMNKIVEKGLLGFAINIAILVALVLR